MDTPDDIARDEWLSELAEQAVEEFTLERMRSYYRTKPDLAVAAARAISEAQDIFGCYKHRGASLVYYVSAAEIGIKDALLRPVIFGLVHNEAVAGLIAKELLSQTGILRYRSLVTKIAEIYAGIDLARARLPLTGPDQNFWERLNTAQEARNGILHRAEQPTPDQFHAAKECATYVISVLVPEVFERLGFTYDPGRGGRLAAA